MIYQMIHVQQNHTVNIATTVYLLFLLISYVLKGYLSRDVLIKLLYFGITWTSPSVRGCAASWVQHSVNVFYFEF